MRPIDRARLFLAERVFDPILQYPSGQEKYKNVIAASRRWVDNLEKVGDVHNYMRYVINAGNTTGEELRELSELGFHSYESTLPDFENQFSAYLDEKTTVEDFVVGKKYSSWVINGVAKKYDIRSGGILVVGTPPHHSAVLIKVNLSGGKYENSWLDGQRLLKYYLKATTRGDKETFSETRLENRAIIEFPDVPVYVFTRSSPEVKKFEFRGLFSYMEVHTDSDQKKWLSLRRRDSVTTYVRMSDFLLEQEQAITQAKMRSQLERKVRISEASKIPEKFTALTTQYYRNPDVVTEVLVRAGGVCETCRLPAPFARASDGSPYLEVHHRIRLADGGHDTVDNATALCPNCHRQAHYG